MNENELKKKLSILNSSSVPKGYWENYWPRLKMKIDAQVFDVTPAKAGAQSTGGVLDPGFRRDDGYSFSRNFIPAFAIMLPVLIGVYWFGGHNAEKGILRIPHVRLASYEGDDRAKRVFEEMLQLFPNRVNWITYVNGKVDFSISSVAYKDARALVPFLVAIPRGKQAFEARVLVRPGQEAAAHAPWMDHSTVDLTWRLDALGQTIHVNCRLTSPDWKGSVESEVRLSPNQGTILGALRWRSQLLQVQLTRLDNAPRMPAPKPERIHENEQDLSL